MECLVVLIGRGCLFGGFVLGGGECLVAFDWMRMECLVVFDWAGMIVWWLCIGRR